MSAAPAVAIRGLRKRFGDVEAVAGVDLVIPEGRVFGLLGPNGAGKTTILRILCGLLQADQGEIRLLGRPLARSWAASVIGLCPQDVVVWEGLTVLEQLRFAGAIQDVPPDVAARRAGTLLRALGLEEQARRLAASLSGGMKRRLNIALALMHDPALLVLDEPQAGLDPQSRVLVREYVRSLAGSRTVIITTHDMEEADKLSDRVAILDRGRILAEGAPDELKAGLDSEEVRIRPRSLEDLFIALTGRGLRE